MRSAMLGREPELAALADLVRAGTGAVLVGDAGIGKSRLADAVAEAVADSFHVERLRGSTVVRDIPFSTVAHLLGASTSHYPAALVHAVANTIVSRGRGRSVLVVVDDIDQVDTGTAAALHHLISSPDAVVLATVRSAHAVHPGVGELWRDRTLERFDIGPLPDDAVAALCGDILGSAVSPELTSAVCTLAAGNPLFARELVLGARAAGDIRYDDGHWSLRRPLQPSRRLHDQIALRVAHLDDEARRGLEVIATCQPLRIAIAEAVVGRDELAVLERSALVDVHQDSEAATAEVRIAHPLVGEVVRARLPLSLERGVKARVARAYGSLATPTSDEVLRGALWMLDAGEDLDGEWALHAADAAHALLAPGLVVRLARIARDDGADHHRTQILLGRAMRDLGEVDEAEAILDSAFRTAPSDHLRAAAAVALAELWTFRRGDAQRTIGALPSMAEAIDDFSTRAPVVAQLMLAHGAAGQFEDALTRGLDIVDDPAVDEADQVPALMGTTLAQAMLGDVDRILERIDFAERLAAHHRELHPFALDQLGLNRALAHHALLDFGRAAMLCQQAINQGGHGARIAGVWEQMQAMGSTMHGDLTSGLAVGRLGSSILADQDPLGMLGMSIGTCDLLVAMTDQESGDMLVVPDDPRLGQIRARVWTDRAAAWRLARDGELEAAANVALAVGADAVQGSHVTWGALALHDAVHYGAVEEATSILAAIDASSPLVATICAHAAAVRDGDAERIDDVGERMRAGGAVVLAARAFVDAARRHHDRGASARSAYRSAVLITQSGGLALPDTGPGTPLTKRETEIAGMAAGGRSSKTIARLLELSKRTVDNHLGSVYDTLAIEGRPTLAKLHHGPATKAS